MDVQYVTVTMVQNIITNKSVQIDINTRRLSFDRAPKARFLDHCVKTTVAPTAESYFLRVLD